MTIEFDEDDAWQREKRDAFLLPFYAWISRGQYRFIDQGKMTTLAERRASPDTVLKVTQRFRPLARRFMGREIGIEEKFQRAPQRKAAWWAYPVETDSCTIMGHESQGWLHTCRADVWLKGFLKRDQTKCDIHMLDLPALREWFLPRAQEFELKPNTLKYRTGEDRPTFNRSVCHFVPFEAVPPEIVLWRGVLRCGETVEAFAARKAEEAKAASTRQSVAQPSAPETPVAPVRYPLGYTDEQRDAACADAERLGYRSSRVIADPDGWEWKNGSWVRKEAA